MLLYSRPHAPVIRCLKITLYAQPLGLLWLAATATLGATNMCCAQFGNQPARDPSQALKNMFESFGKEADKFVPGMFSELTPEQLARLEKIPITTAEEKRFGQQVINNYEASLKTKGEPITRAGEDVEYLKLLVEDVRVHLVNANRYRQIDIALVTTDLTDAYSVPGGHLIFTTGLLQSLQSEAELVGVIAHELSHLDRGHQLLPLKQAKVSPNWNDPRAAMSWMATMFKPFRPELEAQADTDAVRWMMATGYDPRELARLLARWDNRQNQQAAWTNMLPDFAKSHPDAGRRAQSVLKDFDNQPRKPAGLVIGRQNLIQRTPHSQRPLQDQP